MGSRPTRGSQSHKSGDDEIKQSELTLPLDEFNLNVDDEDNLDDEVPGIDSYSHTTVEHIVEQQLIGHEYDDFGEITSSTYRTVYRFGDMHIEVRIETYSSSNKLLDSRDENEWGWP